MRGAELSAPFPYFGGKRRAAAAVWAALGDVGGYVEPFAGSAAVLLARPESGGRRVETLNDNDAWLVNMWRAVRDAPGEVAGHASGPVTEIDYHARLAWLAERRTDDLTSWLEGDPEVFDAKAAGWWLYVVSCGIGDPFGGGPWRVVDGRLVDTRKDDGSRESHGVSRALPHLGTAGQGVHRALPHLGNAGRGVHRALPALGDAGRGVHRAMDGGDQEVALTDYMNTLSRRLRNVRITAGDWRRVLQPSVTRSTAGPNTTGIFLDPPYATSGDVYATTSRGDDHKTISAETRAWCLEHGGEHRIVLCGFGNEHDQLLDHGWRLEAGQAGGGAGYNTDSRAGKRERLWLSPTCLGGSDALFGFDMVSEDGPRASGWYGGE